MTALTNFIRAAASYFGVPVDQLTEGCAVDSSTGEFEVVLRVALTPDDLKGIAGRMEAMLVDVQAEAEEPVVNMPSNEELRALWDSLPKPEKSAFGSFGVFKAKWGFDPLPQAEGAGMPDHVWVPRQELTAQQRALALGTVEDGSRYAMDPADLSEEQRAEYEPGFVRGGQ